MQNVQLETVLRGYEWGSRFAFSEPPHSPLGAAGNLLSRTVGSSLEFMDHREYLPGDDLRRIDWNGFARSDRLNIKLFRDEVNPHVDVLLDGSKSMSIRHTQKQEAAIAMAGFFAAVAAESKFSFSLYTTEQGCQRVGCSHLLPTEWAPIDLNSTVSFHDSLFRLPPTWRRMGIRVVISDLLFLADPNLLVGQLAQDSAVTVVVQLLAKDDAQPPEAGNVRLVDTETGEVLEMYLDTLARERYMASLAAHQENYHLACRRHGVTMTTLIAEDFLSNHRVDELMSFEILRPSS